jgi:ABC-type Fe3+-hydroxamate transport system substrate-binding protein
VRVVSLVPSVSETLRRWCVDPVAVSRFCEQPDLPTVGGTKDPDIAAIVDLAPDLVVLDREENRRDDADALVAAGLALHVTHVTALADVAPMLAALAAAVGVASPAALAAITVPSVAAVRRAFVPIWRRPWMTCNGDTYGMSLLRALGIVGCFDGAPERYPTVELDDVVARRPDLVLLPSEPYPFAGRHVPELRAVAADVRLVDGRDLFWWGVRTPDALARLGQVLGA